LVVSGLSWSGILKVEYNLIKTEPGTLPGANISTFITNFSPVVAALYKAIQDARAKSIPPPASTTKDDSDYVYVWRTIYNIFGFPIGQERVRQRRVFNLSPILIPTISPIFIPNIRSSSPNTRIGNFLTSSSNFDDSVPRVTRSPRGSPRVPRSPRSSPRSSPKSSKGRRGGYYEKYMKYKAKYIALKKQLS
jgi:hypothetical protein